MEFDQATHTSANQFYIDASNDIHSMSEFDQRFIYLSKSLLIMCGRYSFTSGAEILTSTFGLKTAPSLKPRYNISPAQKCPVILKIDNGEKYLSSMRWGLIPHWSKGPNSQFSMFNARSETANSKPAFCDSFEKRHCLIPADGYYEWTTTETAKQAYRITTENETTFGFAGLWDIWEGDSGPIYSFTILTSQSCPEVSAIHHRMPIIIRRDHYNDWLTAVDTETCLSNHDCSQLKAVPVSPNVNNPSNGNPDRWLA